MPRSFAVSAESPASVEQVFSAFGNEDYWRARLALFGNGAATLDSLAVDADGTVSAAVAINLVRERLPKVVSRLHGLGLDLVQTERWSRMEDGRLRGQVNVAAIGVPLSGAGEGVVAPVCDGSRLNYTATVEVKVPLIGGQVEKFIGGQLADGINEILRVTTEWIAANS